MMSTIKMRNFNLVAMIYVTVIFNHKQFAHGTNSPSTSIRGHPQSTGTELDPETAKSQVSDSPPPGFEGKGKSALNETDIKAPENLSSTPYRIPYFIYWSQLPSSVPGYVVEEATAILMQDFTIDLVKTPNRDHNIWRNINIISLCEVIRVSLSYVKMIDETVQGYQAMDTNYWMYDEKKSKEPIRAISCQLKGGDKHFELFVTAPPEHAKYGTVKDLRTFVDRQTVLMDLNSIRDRVLVLACSDGICSELFSIVITDFEKTYPVLKFTEFEEIELTKNFSDEIIKDHNILRNIDMNKFTRELYSHYDTTKHGLYIVDQNPKINKFKMRTMHLKTKEDVEVNIVARNTGMQVHLKQPFDIYVTASSDSRTSIILLLCYNKVCGYYMSLNIEHFDHHYPAYDMIIDNSINKKILMRNMSSEILKDHRIWKTIDMENFCEKLRITSRGYFTRIMNPRNQYYTKSPYTLISDQRQTAIHGKTCNLLILDNPNEEIVITTPPENELFQPIFDRVILLNCTVMLECRLLSSVVVDLGLMNQDFKPIAIRLVPELNILVLEEQIASKQYKYHRILKNIRVDALCNLISGFYSSSTRFEAKQNRTPLGYSVVTDIVLTLEDDSINENVRGRSCQLQEITNPANELYITAPPYLKEILQYNIRDVFYLLLCNEQRKCNIDTGIGIRNLDKYFPIISSGMISDPSLNNKMHVYLFENIRSRERILEDINMMEFCERVLDFSGGLYIKNYKNKITFKVKEDQRIIGTPPSSIIKSRDCGLKKITQPHLEIFVAPPPYFRQYRPYDKRFVLLSCDKDICTPETTVIFENLEKDYPLLQYGMKANDEYNEAWEIGFQKWGSFTNHKIIQTDNIKAFCQNLSQFAEGNYRRLPNPDKDGYNVTLKKRVAIPPSYEMKLILSRSCLLIKKDKPEQEIVITSPPVFMDNLQVTDNHIMILSCIKKECSPETMLMVYNIDKALTPISDRNQDRNSLAASKNKSTSALRTSTPAAIGSPSRAREAVKRRRDSDQSDSQHKDTRRKIGDHQDTSLDHGNKEETIARSSKSRVSPTEAGNKDKAAKVVDGQGSDSKAKSSTQETGKHRRDLQNDGMPQPKSQKINDIPTEGSEGSTKGAELDKVRSSRTEISPAVSHNQGKTAKTVHGLNSPSIKETKSLSGDTVDSTAAKVTTEQPHATESGQDLVPDTIAERVKERKSRSVAELVSRINIPPTQPQSILNDQETPRYFTRSLSKKSMQDKEINTSKTDENAEKPAPSTDAMAEDIAENVQLPTNSEGNSQVNIEKEQGLASALTFPIKKGKRSPRGPNAGKIPSNESKDSQDPPPESEIRADLEAQTPEQSSSAADKELQMTDLQPTLPTSPNHSTQPSDDLVPLATHKGSSSRSEMLSKPTSTSHDQLPDLNVTEDTPMDEVEKQIIPSQSATTSHSRMEIDLNEPADSEGVDLETHTPSFATPAARNSPSPQREGNQVVESGTDTFRPFENPWSYEGTSATDPRIDVQQPSSSNFASSSGKPYSPLNYQYPPPTGASQYPTVPYGQSFTNIPYSATRMQHDSAPVGSQYPRYDPNPNYDSTQTELHTDRSVRHQSPGDTIAENAHNMSYTDLESIRQMLNRKHQS